MKIEKLQSSLKKLQDNIEGNDYSGYDPYDGLKSPVFSLPFLRSSKTIRFLFQQSLKRTPLNLRKLFLVPKGENPVTLGLCIQAYSYLSETTGGEGLFETKINSLLERLERLRPHNFQNACWGYDFPWEARYFSLPAYAPTIVATGIIINSLFENFRMGKSEKIKNIILSAGKFIHEDINRSVEDNEKICFSYSPFDYQKVYNASMKGVRVLSYCYSITGDEEIKNLASKAVDYVLEKQNPDGSWFYSGKDSSRWIDNYHTGYVLDCLSDFIDYCTPADGIYLRALEKGAEFYLDNFFAEGAVPKFYNSRLYPVDSTAGAQSILTLLKLRKPEKALEVAEWMIDNMQNKDGSFYFRKYRNFTVRIPFMRWSNAWMFASLAKLVVVLK